MRIVRLETVFLRPASSYTRTVAQDQFDQALREASKTLGHFDGNVQWAVVEDVGAGARLIAEQLRAYYRIKLDSLGLKPSDLQFQVLSMPIENALVWAGARHLHNTVYDASAGLSY